MSDKMKKLMKVQSEQQKQSTSEDDVLTVNTTAPTEEEVAVVKMLDARAKSTAAWDKFCNKDFSANVLKELQTDGETPKGAHLIDPMSGITAKDFARLVHYDGAATVALNNCSEIAPEIFDVFNDMVDSCEGLTPKDFGDLENLCKAARLTGSPDLAILKGKQMAKFASFRSANKDLSVVHVEEAKAYHVFDAVSYVDYASNALAIIQMEEGEFEWTDVAYEGSNDEEKKAYVDAHFEPAEKELAVCDLAKKRDLCDAFVANSYYHLRYQCSGLVPSVAKVREIDPDLLRDVIVKQDELLRAHCHEKVFDDYVLLRDEFLRGVRTTYDPHNAPYIKISGNLHAALNAVRRSIVKTLRENVDASHRLSVDELAAFRTDRGILGDAYKEFRSAGTIITDNEKHSVLAKWDAAFMNVANNVKLKNAIAFGHSQANHWNDLLTDHGIAGNEGDILTLHPSEYPDAYGLISDVWLIPDKTNSTFKSGPTPSDATAAGLSHQTGLYTVYKTWLASAPDRYVLVKAHPVPSDSGSSRPMGYLLLHYLSGKYCQIVDERQCRSHNGERIFLITNKPQSDDAFLLSEVSVDIVDDVYLTEAYYSNVLRNVALFTGYPIIYPHSRDNPSTDSPLPPNFVLRKDLWKSITMKGSHQTTAELNEGKDGTVPLMDNATAAAKRVESIKAVNKRLVAKDTKTVKVTRKVVPGSEVVRPVHGVKRNEKKRQLHVKH